MRGFVTGLLVAVGMALSMTAAQASFIGDQFSQYYYYPDTSSPYGGYSASHPTFTAPFNGELGVVEGVTSIDAYMNSNTLIVSFNTSLHNPTWSNAAFNGLVLTLQGPSTLNIAGIVILPGTNMAGFDASRVSFSSTTISLNFAGLSYECDTKVKIGFTFQPPTRAPEPATIALVGGGLSALGRGAMRRRRKSARVS